VFQVFANAGTDEEMCSGGSVTLTATGGSSYEWNSGPTTDVINVSPLADTEYIVTVTGVNSCQDVDTVLVTVHDLPTADAGTDVDICTGNSANLTATGGVDFEWNGGQTSATISVSPLVDTEYTVTVTDSFGCENSDAVMVFVHSLPVANAGTDQNICFGETANLSATGGVSYEWNSGQLVADITVAPTITTDYIVTVTDIWSCENTDTVTVNVFQVFANTGTDEEICSGGSVTLTATGGSSYEWNSGPTTDVINVSPLADTEYIVTVTGVNSCQDVDTVLVTVHDLPTADAGTDVDICTGNSANLTATGGVDFEWNGGQTSASINVSPLVDTEYTVTVTDSFGCENSDAVMVFVHSIPVANAGTDQNICFGETANLSATGGVSYEWNSGQLVADITIAPTITTEYIVTVTDIWSCENTDTVTVNVFQVFANAGTDEEMCSGGSVTLTATGGSSYEWNSGPTTDVINVSPLADTEYIVTVTGVNSCQDVDTVLVTVHDLPTADAGTDVDICTGNSANLTATGGVDFEWSSGQTSASINVSPLVDTEYTVTVTDVYGCENSDAVMVFVHSLPVANAGTDQNICFGETADLSATGGVTYEWNSGQLIADITVAPTITTDYIVTVTDIWSCENTDTVTVNVFQVFANAGTDEEICSGGSITLTATGGSSYEWNSGPTTDVINVSPLADTEYIVTVTGVNSCQDVDTVLVTVLSLPVIPETPTGITERCQTAETTEFFISEVSGADSYIWTLYPEESGSNTTDQNTLTINWNINFTGITGIYVEAVNTCGTSRSDTIYIQTNPSPFPALGNDTTICSGNFLTLDAGYAETWNWTNGYTSQTIETNEAGTLGVEVFIGSCSNYDEITIFVSDTEVEFGQDTIHSDAAVVLDAGTGFSEYLWNDNSTEQTLLAENPGWYFITVTNEFGCTDYDSVYVDIISGIKFTLEPQISIYPNPVEDKLIVKIDSKYSKIVKIELIGIDSKIIESRAFNGVSNLDEYFDMNGFATGIYVLRIEFENDLKLFKILKQ
jgi:predicted transcriptional regulator